MPNLTKPTNSLMSNIYLNSKMPEPVVGMGATACYYTDRHACTVIEVRGPKTIVVQEDTATRSDNLGMSDCQSYEYSPNPNGHKYVVTLRNNGRWVKQGQSAKNGLGLVIGRRMHYYDYSF